MSVNKKYFWLKLPKDYFTKKEIKKLRLVAGGDTFTIIYLKMQLLAINTDGYIEFEGTESNLIEQIALELDEKIENVELTINFLINNLLLEVVDNSYFLPQVPNLVGKEGSSAKRVREHRKSKLKMLHCNTDVTKCNTEKEKDKEKDIEKDIEIDIEKEKENAKKIDFFAEYNFSEDLKLILIDFIEHRKSIKKPIKTQNTFDLLIKKLNKLSKNEDEQIEILENSILNGYSGIFELKKDYNKKELEKREQINKNIEYYLED